MLYPCCMISEVTAFVLDGIGMIELSKKSYFLENILPLFDRLFSEIRHFFDGNDFSGDETSRVINSSEAAMSNFAEILENLFRVILLKQFCNLGILEASWPRNGRHITLILPRATGIPSSCSNLLSPWSQLFLQPYRFQRTVRQSIADLVASVTNPIHKKNTIKKLFPPSCRIKEKAMAESFNRLSVMKFLLAILVQTFF